MDIITMAARPRDGKGKSYTRKLRAGGWIPANVYGHGVGAQSLEINGLEFLDLLRKRKTNHIIQLNLDKKDGGEKVTIIKEIQRNALKDDKVFHVDFQVIRMDEKVTVQCPVEVVGTPVGVKEESGVFEHPVRHLTVECLPMNIPDVITVDVSGLGVGDSIHVRDISVPDAEIKDSEEEVIAAVHHERVVEEEPAEAAEGEEEGAEGEAGGSEGDGGGEKASDEDGEKKE